MELTEYIDTDRKPAQPRVQDPGASTLILSARDIDTIVARVKKSGAHINTAGGVPATIQTGANRIVLLRDPYGLMLEILPAPQSR